MVCNEVKEWVNRFFQAQKERRFPMFLPSFAPDTWGGGTTVAMWSATAAPGGLGADRPSGKNGAGRQAAAQPSHLA